MSKERMKITVLTIICWLVVTGVLIAEDISDKYPKPFAVPKWLETSHQRLLFDIWPEKQWAEQGVNIACAGTNASPFPYVWDGKDRFLHIETGEECDYERFNAYIKKADELGVKIFWTCRTSDWLDSFEEREN